METGSAHDLGRHLGYWMRRVSNHVSGTFARALQERGTSVAEWVVLCEVQRERGISPGKLASSLGLTRGAISKIVAKLEVKGWISCAANPQDSRGQRLSLTARGRRVLPGLAAIADGNDRSFFDCLVAAEQTELRRILVKLAAANGITNIPVD